MIFTIQIAALPQEPLPYLPTQLADGFSGVLATSDELQADDKHPYTTYRMTHGDSICQADLSSDTDIYAFITCTTTPAVSIDKAISRVVTGDLPSHDEKNIFGQKYTAYDFHQYSLDFYQNDLCVVSKEGGLACGTQSKLGYYEYKLDQMKQPKDVTDIRLSQDPKYSFMCLRNWNGEVWCRQYDMDKDAEWHRIEQFKDREESNFVDSIQIVGSSICAHFQDVTEISTYQCIEIGSTFDEDAVGGQTMKPHTL
eukprot:NODE_1280_length_1449_cov_0.401481.p1 type:complete len:254 gc:universal NODE_1280_length_1449_cov_0.401481:173-934(+)